MENYQESKSSVSASVFSASLSSQRISFLRKLSFSYRRVTLKLEKPTMNESRRQFYRNTESEPRWASPASGYFHSYDPGNPFFFFYDPVYVSFLVNCSAQRALSLRKFYYFLTFGWHLKLKNSGSSYLMSSQQACRSSLATLPLLCLVFRRKDDWVDWVFFITVVKCA